MEYNRHFRRMWWRILLICLAILALLVSAYFVTLREMDMLPSSVYSLFNTAGITWEGERKELLHAYWNDASGSSDGFEVLVLSGEYQPDDVWTEGSYTLPENVRDILYANKLILPESFQWKKTLEAPPEGEIWDMYYSNENIFLLYRGHHLTADAAADAESR